MELGGGRIAGLGDVSRETLDLLAIYAETLKTWQKTHNLVSSATIGDLWQRHVADSAQLVPLLPNAATWLDLGTGAGLPGLVVAILIRNRPGAMVHLVESNAKKCAFLATAVRRTGVPAQVHRTRIEDLEPDRFDSVDAVAARALAPLGKLLGYAAPFIHRGAIGVFQKGQDVEMELTEAARYWNIEHDKVASQTSDSGVILLVRNCRRLTD